MNRQVVLRLLDTFFRRWWLYLVPVALLALVGLRSVNGMTDSYQSVGTIKVERSALVSQLTETSRDPDFGWETPAAATAGSVSSLLRTEKFIDDVAVNAGLEDELEAGLITTMEMRASIGVVGDGTRLVKVIGTHWNPEVAQSLADGVITSYRNSVIGNESTDSTIAIEFLNEKLPGYEEDVREAQATLDTWIAQHPLANPDADRPENEVVELARLEGEISARQEVLNNARARVEQAQLELEQKEAEVGQRLQVLDAPELPTAPQPKLKKAVTTMGLAIIVAFILSLIAVVVTTILDRSLRTPGDVTQRLGTKVLAVVPRARLSRRQKKQLKALDLPQPTVSTHDLDPLVGGLGPVVPERAHSTVAPAARERRNGDSIPEAEIVTESLDAESEHPQHQTHARPPRRRPAGTRPSFNLKRTN